VNAKMYRQSGGRMLTVVMAATMLCSPAYAQGTAAAPTAQTAQKAPPAKQDLEDARKHYESGLDLYSKEAYEAALVEFERAYQLAPTYRILYNTGLIYQARNDFVAAITAFQRYLSEGGAEVPAARRTEVEGYIAKLNTLVAKVEVTSHVDGADVSLDDIPQGKIPLGHPLFVNPGRRKITVSRPGFSPAIQVVTVVPGDVANVALEPHALTIRDEREKGMPLIIPIGWGVTVLAVAGAVTFGVASSRESSKLDTAKGSPTAQRADLDDRQSKMRTYAGAADIFTVGAIVAGGASLYFTLKYIGRDKTKKETTPGMTVGMTPGSILLSGKF
jgi:hypothetical protein